MAFIYRYSLENGQKKTALSEYEQLIQDVIERLFGKNLKEEVRITDEYFEFKLYSSVSNYDLQEMGRRLSAIPRSPEKGFRRMEQSFYTILYPSENENDFIYAEFFDFKDFEDIKRFRKQAERYTEAYLDRNQDIIIQLPTEDIALNNLFYVDVLSAEIDNRIISICKFLPNKITEPTICLVKGEHRTKENELNEEYSEHRKYYDSQTIMFDNIPDAVYLNEIGNPVNNQTNFLKIKKITSIDQNKISEILDNITLLIPEAITIDALEKIKPTDKLKLTVYNVGQGLSTSLTKNEEYNPFVFFDFGMAEGKNYFTKPNSMTQDTTSEATIILSHIHRDHWFKISMEKSAFSCHWYIPDQPRKSQFNKKCAEIIYNGGAVSIIKNSVPFSRGILYCHASSSFHKHETGMVLRINADINGVTGGLLIAGDQRYDFIAPQIVCELHMLVATHHGGEYSAKASTLVPSPMWNGESLLVYSYGLGSNGRINTHSHPSKRAKYAQWKNVHETPIINNDFVINI